MQLSKEARARRRLIAGGILLVLLVAGGIVFFMRKDSSRFASEYAAYETLAAVQEQNAYVPAASDNPIRQQLDDTLSATLDQRTSASARLQDAQNGLGLVAQLDKEVDAIGDASESANTALAKLQVDTYGGLTSSDASHGLISLAESRSSTIEAIRGLSYRADFETATIFNNIIAAKGVLASSYVAQLNNDIPSLEADFNRRTQLYTQLTQTSTQIDQAETALGIPVSMATSSASQ